MFFLFFLGWRIYSIFHEKKIEKRQENLKIPEAKVRVYEFFFVDKYYAIFFSLAPKKMSLIARDFDGLAQELCFVFFKEEDLNFPRDGNDAFLRCSLLLGSQTALFFANLEIYNEMHQFEY